MASDPEGAEGKGHFMDITSRPVSKEETAALKLQFVTAHGDEDLSSD